MALVVDLERLRSLRWKKHEFPRTLALDRLVEDQQGGMITHDRLILISRSRVDHEWITEDHDWALS